MMKIKNRIKFPAFRLTMLPRPDWRQLVIPAVSLLFLIMMTKLVVTQNHALETPFAGEDFYIRFMVFLAGFVVLASLYSMAVDANFMTLIAGACILYTIGASYQFLFGGATKYCLVGAGSLVCAAVVYAICRRVGDLSERREDRVIGRMFVGIVVAIFLLLLANYCFGYEDRGARLTILIGPEDNPYFAVQPGEYIKVLLMILGACSYHNRKRALIYCATTVFACMVLVGMINDLGNAMVIYFMFVWMTYQLFDNQKFSIGLIVAAFMLVALVALVKPHVVTRFRNWGHVMDIRGDANEQFPVIRSIIFGGIGGRGLADSANVLKINAVEHDVALGGVTAIYGIAITIIAMMGYTLLAAQPAFNRSVHPSGYLMLGQFSIYIFAQSALNLGGSLDTLPFTGVVAPLISEGANQMVCIGVLLGLAAAAIHPRVVWKE